ncbi:MAG: ion channel [Gammaproteobacteria bacterium]|nr:ion channel [Gammaproteobacteria bacterium]
MNENDPFWQLSGLREISSQAQLLEELEGSDTLSRIWYLPRVVEWEEGQEREIKDKRFVSCRFSHTQIVGFTFRHCTFEGCLLIGSKFKGCKFHKCSFRSTNTYRISIEGTYIDPLSFDGCLNSKKHQNIGTHLYQELLRNSRDADQILFEQDAKFLFLKWERYQKWYEIKKKLSQVGKSGLKFSFLLEVWKGSLSCLGRWLWEFSAGSGLRISRFSSSATSIALVFSAINYLCRQRLGLKREGDLIEGYWDALYFTIISLTTLGYGDIAPTTTAGQLWASFQSIVGFILFATLASMLFRRFFP